MKTSGTLLTRKIIICFLLFCSCFFRLSALPDYSFTSPSLLSGTDLTAGAVYLFKNVKAGVDAKVTVVSMSGGISLYSIDETWTGFDEAFQPFINVPAHSDGYIEFEILFCKAGTNIPLVQSEVPITPIDVDGAGYTNGTLYEQDQIKLGGGYYNFSTSTSEISVTNSSGWVTGRNISGWSYDGVDTTARAVMFTVVNSNTNKVTMRIGAENNSDDFDIRYRSVYFKKFYYPNGLLATSSFLNFSGSAAGNDIELKYLLNEPEKIRTVVVEKSFSDMKFSAVREVAVNAGNASYDVRDPFTSGISYYRLKIIQHSGAISYSNVLKFDNNNVKEVYKVFPSAVNDRATVMIHAANAGPSELHVIDYSGKIVYSKTLTMQKGINNTTIDGLGTLSRGNYVVVVRSRSNLYSQKIMKQ